jgi:RimJ/RimL family protein N-acetyltransferase
MDDAWAMTTAGSVSLREVSPADIPIFFEQQIDPVAAEMAAFPSREREEHAAHWDRVGSNPAVVNRTIVVDGDVAGNVVSWVQEGHQEIGYWLGREYWGRGIATVALSQFVELVRVRPLYAWVAEHNGGSIRVLEKTGFVVAADQPEPDAGATRYVVMELRDG